MSLISDKKIYIAFFLFVISFVIYMFFFTAIETVDKKTFTTIENKEISKTSVIKEKFDFKFVKKNDKDLKIRKKETNKKIIEEPFTEISIEDVLEGIPFKPTVQPLSAFSFKKNTIKKLSIGDKLKLPLINGDEFVVTAKRITKYKDTISIMASIDESPSEYYAVLTEGKKSSFITLNSPEGLFEIEIFNGQGYIYSSDDIKKNMINTSISDEIKING